MAQTYLNKKQELFCKFVAEGMTYTQAYETAGYEPSSANASTLASKPLVKARIAELKEDSERRAMEFQVLVDQTQGMPEAGRMIQVGAEWTFQRVMDMMGENVKLAQIAGEYKAANECLKLMGEAMKMFEKVAGGNDKPALPGAGSLTLIGKVVNALGGDPDAADEGPANALRPAKVTA